jgi:hypothetical protein
MQEILSKKIINFIFERNFVVKKRRAPHDNNIELGITFIGGQTDGTDEVCYRHAIVESKQRHIIIEITVTKFLRYRSQYEARLGAHRVIATIVLAECNLDHEPHEAFDLESVCVLNAIMKKGKLISKIGQKLGAISFHLHSERLKVREMMSFMKFYSEISLRKNLTCQHIAIIDKHST